jgi:uncharacterized membrane protein
MTTTRLEAFSDGVLAIIITIMVLELKVPHEPTWDGLMKLAPVFNSYVLSFIYIGIYWGNHHHLLHTTKRVSWKIIWANMHQLFWLSLIPFSTGWMGENHFTQATVVLYGIILLLSGIAFYILQLVIQQEHPKNTELARAFEKLQRKGLLSLMLYLLAISLAFVNTTFSMIIYVVCAIIWLIPDRNIEKAIVAHE